MRHSKLILLFLSMTCAGPALAGPREDSLAAISRCASLPDDRTFLDCVYGAMQPMRADLMALFERDELAKYYTDAELPPGQPAKAEESH